MDAHSHHSEDLNELERRLSAWQPSDAGLDADAMLFAAGCASVRPGRARLVWPALTAVLTALAIVLGLGLASERRERLALVRQLREPPPAPSVTPFPQPSAITTPVESPSYDEPSPDSYLASRPALEKGLDAWPIQAVARRDAEASALTDTPILRLGQRDALLDP